MNSPKQPLKRALRLSLISAALATSSLAHAEDVNKMLSMAKQLKAIYQSQQAESGADQATKDLNSDANISHDCNELMKAKVAASQNHVKNKTPPDPTQVIANSTCFVDVMDIQIPTTGYGFLDAVVGALSPYVKNQSCNATSGWWNDMKSKMSNGQYTDLINSGFQKTAGGNVSTPGFGNGSGSGSGSGTTTIGAVLGSAFGNSTGGSGSSSGAGSTTGAGGLTGIIGATVGAVQQPTQPTQPGQPVVIQPAQGSPASPSYLQTIATLRGQLGL